MSDGQTEINRAVGTQLTDEHIKLVALKIAVQILLAHEAGRNPDFAQSAKAALDAALGRAGATGILAEKDDTGFLESVRAEFHDLLGGADALAENAKGDFPTGAA